MGTKNNPGEFDCYANAEPDEPMFILLGRDPMACALVDLWAQWREEDGEAWQKVRQAHECANEMRRWLFEHGKQEWTRTQKSLYPSQEILKVKKILQRHQENLRYHSGDGLAGSIEGLLRVYEDRAAKAIHDAKQVRDDFLTYFRAWVIILEMTANASTHREKNARLRGAVELLEQMINRLRYSEIGVLTNGFRWPDIFSSDLSTRPLLDRIHELEKEVESLKQPAAPSEESVSVEGANGERGS